MNIINNSYRFNYTNNYLIMLTIQQTPLCTDLVTALGTAFNAKWLSINRLAFFFG